MAGQRSKGQKLIAVPMDESLLECLDKARDTMSRSAFVRSAILSALVDLGYDIPKSLSDAPDRAGKGGAPTHRKTFNHAAEDAASYDHKKR